MKNIIDEWADEHAGHGTPKLCCKSLKQRISQEIDEPLLFYNDSINSRTAKVLQELKQKLIGDQK